MFRSLYGPFIYINIPIHFCKFTHKATQPPSSFIPATGTTMQVCIPEVQCHPQNFFLLHSDALVLHSFYDQVMYVLYSVCKMHDFPSVSIRLPLYLFSIAGNGLLIYSHQLFFVLVKAIFILKSGLFFYIYNMSDYKCHPNLLLEKIPFLFMILL